MRKSGLKSTFHVIEKIMETKGLSTLELPALICVECIYALFIISSYIILVVYFFLVNKIECNWSFS